MRETRHIAGQCLEFSNSGFYHSERTLQYDIFDNNNTGIAIGIELVYMGKFLASIYLVEIANVLAYQSCN